LSLAAADQTVRACAGAPDYRRAALQPKSDGNMGADLLHLMLRGGEGRVSKHSFRAGITLRDAAPRLLRVRF
jgi:hypothetical protein